MCPTTVQGCPAPFCGIKSPCVVMSVQTMTESLALASRGWWEVAPWQAGPVRDHESRCCRRAGAQPSTAVGAHPR